MKNVEKVFDNGQPTLREWKLKPENEELKKLIGELTLELKHRGPPTIKACWGGSDEGLP